MIGVTKTMHSNTFPFNHKRFHKKFSCLNIISILLTSDIYCYNTHIQYTFRNRIHKPIVQLQSPLLILLTHVDKNQDPLILSRSFIPLMDSSTYRCFFLLWRRCWFSFIWFSPFMGCCLWRLCRPDTC